MAADSRGLLSLGIFNGDGTLIHDRWRDFILLTPIFLLLSWKVSRAVEEITKCLVDELPENDRLPFGIAEAKESPLGEIRPAPSSTVGSLLRNVGARFLILLVALWILNTVSCTLLQAWYGLCAYHCLDYFIEAALMIQRLFMYFDGVEGPMDERHIYPYQYRQCDFEASVLYGYIVLYVDA